MYKTSIRNYIYTTFEWSFFPLDGKMINPLILSITSQGQLKAICILNFYFIYRRIGCGFKASDANFNSYCKRIFTYKRIENVAFTLFRQMRSRQELYPVSFKCARYISYIEAIKSVSTLLVRGFTDAIKSWKIVGKWQKIVLWDIYLFLCRSENFIALW